jgi:hypothetical protein
MRPIHTLPNLGKAVLRERAKITSHFGEVGQTPANLTSSQLTVHRCASAGPDLPTREDRGWRDTKSTGSRARARMIGDMSTVRITESELARDVYGVLKKVQQGVARGCASK